MKLESIVSDQFYHIYNRGNNKENIFIEERNYAYFLHLIKIHVLPIADIYAYCLLKNHFHLLVKTKASQEAPKISKGFSNLFNAYTKSFNKAYERSGSLFKKPFSRIRITDEKYLQSLIFYIHLNPQHHKFAKDFIKYPHSSYNALLSNKQTALRRQDVIAIFDDLDNFILCHKNRGKYLSEIDSALYLE